MTSQNAGNRDVEVTRWNVDIPESGTLQGAIIGLIHTFAGSATIAGACWLAVGGASLEHTVIGCIIGVFHAVFFGLSQLLRHEFLGTLDQVFGILMMLLPLLYLYIAESWLTFVLAGLVPIALIAAIWRHLEYGLSPGDSGKHSLGASGRVGGWRGGGR